MSGLARAATTVSLAFVASRALGVLREVIIAQQFGTSPELDAYRAAFVIPDTIYLLIAGGALASPPTSPSRLPPRRMTSTFAARFPRFA